jgi:hypothetical protein
METRLTLRPGQPGTRKPRRQDDDIVYVRIVYHETELRERAKRLGAIWRHPQRLWEITFRDSKRLGIEDRIVEGEQRHLSKCRHVPAYGAIHY